MFIASLETTLDNKTHIMDSYKENVVGFVMCHQLEEMCHAFTKTTFIWEHYNSSLNRREHSMDVKLFHHVLRVLSSNVNQALETINSIKVH